MTEIWETLTANAGTVFSLTFAAISAIAAAASGYFAWRAQARKQPICEVSTDQDEPWPGWCRIRVTVTNTAPAWLDVVRVQVPMFYPGTLIDPETIMVTRHEQAPKIDWLQGDRDVEMMEVRQLPDAPPTQPKGCRVIASPQPAVAPDGERRRRLQFLAPPAGNGQPLPPQHLKVICRWRDQRHRTIRIKVMT